jgi:hypothetical protein
MGELYNYVVVADVDAESVQQALLRELLDPRGWKAVTGEATGARHLTLWRAGDVYRQRARR